MTTAGALLLVFLYEVGAAVVLPTPSELAILGQSWAPIGLILLFAVAGKTAGAYLVFFLGSRARRTERFKRLTARYAILQTVLDHTERFVRRFGLPAIFVLLSIPGLPDTLPLYLFALVSDRPAIYAIASGLGTVVRFAVVLTGVHGVSLLK